MYGNRPKTTTNEYPRYPCRSSSVKDKSLFTQSWDADGSAQDLWDEDYAVINFRGEEVFRTPSRIEAERWIRAETARFFGGALNPS
jgi:hypothetical protein